MMSILHDGVNFYFYLKFKKLKSFLNDEGYTI